MNYEKDEVLWKDRKHFMWFPFSFVKYEIRNERLYEQSGLLNTTYEELLLYKVIDMTLTQSLGQKIFGTGTIYLTTRADTAAQVVLKNIKHPKEVKDLISELTEQIRQNRNVVGKEFYGHGPLEDLPPED